jgi:hypothetical protein
MSDTISISKTSLKIFGAVVLFLVIGAGIICAAYCLGKDAGAAQTPVVIQQVVEPTVTPTPTTPQPAPIPTSATFKVYQKFEDTNGVLWLQTVDNTYYRVAFVNDYNSVTIGYTYQAEFTGQVIGGYQIIGSLSYVTGAPVLVYSLQDNEYHNVNAPLVDTNTYDYHLFDKVLYEDEHQRGTRRS